MKFWGGGGGGGLESRHKCTSKNLSGERPRPAAYLPRRRALAERVAVVLCMTLAKRKGKFKLLATLKESYASARLALEVHELASECGSSSCGTLEDSKLRAGAHFGPDLLHSSMSSRLVHRPVRNCPEQKRSAPAHAPFVIRILNFALSPPPTHLSVSDITSWDALPLLPGTQ